MNKTQNNSLLKPASTLFTGASFSLLVGFGSQLLLARFISDVEFGLFDALTSLAGVFAVVLSLRFEDAFTLPRSIQGASNLLALTMLLCGGLTLLLFPFVLFPAHLAAWLRMPELAPLLPLLPLMALSMALIRVFELWLNRFKSFKIISEQRMVASLSTAFLQFLSVAFRGGAAGISWGFIGGRMIAVAMMLTVVWRNRLVSLRNALQPRYLRYTFKKYYKFALFTMPAALLGSLPLTITTLGLGYYFGTQTVGQFGRGYRYLAIAATLLANALGQVFLASASEAHRENRLPHETKRFLWRLMAVLWFPFGWMLVDAPFWFVFILGAEWKEAGEYAQVVSVWLFFAALASPLTILFDVLQKQSLDLATNLALTALQIFALVWSAASFDPLWTVQVLSCTGLLSRLAQIAILLALAQVPFSTLGIYLLKILGFSSFALASYWFLKDESAFWLHGLTLVLSFVFYGLMVLKDLRKEKNM